jgi:hypothetical protein
MELLSRNRAICRTRISSVDGGHQPKKAGSSDEFVTRSSNELAATIALNSVTISG